MITNISLVKERVMSRIRSVFLWLTITCRYPVKSRPQYVGPKVVAIDSYSRPTMRHTYAPADFYENVQNRNTVAMLNRMEPELSGATADPDTGSDDKRWQQLPWFPTPRPEPKTNGLRASWPTLGSIQATANNIQCPDAVEIIPGLVTTL